MGAKQMWPSDSNAMPSGDADEKGQVFKNHSHDSLQVSLKVLIFRHFNDMRPPEVPIAMRYSGVPLLRGMGAL